MDVYQYLLDAGIGEGNPGTPVPRAPLPIAEDGPLRAAPYPGAHAVEGGGVHDNVAMEAALAGAFAGAVTALRPGAIYGPHPDARERLLVEMVREGRRTLALPGGGDQIFHRVAVERVGRAVAAALTHRSPTASSEHLGPHSGLNRSLDGVGEGFWAGNVGDPGDWTYGGLAGEVARLLDWEFEFERVGRDEADHPWNSVHPVLCDTRRLEHGARRHRARPGRGAGGVRQLAVGEPDARTIRTRPAPRRPLAAGCSAAVATSAAAKPAARSAAAASVGVGEVHRDGAADERREPGRERAAWPARGVSSPTCRSER